MMKSATIASLQRQPSSRYGESGPRARRRQSQRRAVSRTQLSVSLGTSRSPSRHMCPPTYSTRLGIGKEPINRLMRQRERVELRVMDGVMIHESVASCQGLAACARPFALFTTRVALAACGCVVATHAVVVRQWSGRQHPYCSACATEVDCQGVPELFLVPFVVGIHEAAWRGRTEEEKVWGGK